MLIIAQPKSASTSLLKTLALILKLKYKNGISRTTKDKLCEGFEELQKYHSTTHQRSFKFLKDWITCKTIIYKDHILPTKNHIAYINKINYPIVILIRNPEDSLNNYKRLLENYHNGKLSKAEIKELQLERLDKIDMNKLYLDILKFHHDWITAKVRCALYVDFDTLIMSSFHTCKKIVEHYRFRMPKLKTFALLKAKGNHGYNTYTGVGVERIKKNICN